MTERIPSDHETVESHRVRLATVGRTDRPEVELPAAVQVDTQADVDADVEADVETGAGEGDGNASNVEECDGNEGNVEEGDVIRLFIGGEEGHARVEGTLTGASVLRGAFQNARLARADTREGAEDLLANWRDERGLEAGAALLFDEVTPGFAYGIRKPGERVLYPDRQPPSDDLSAIAETLED